MPIYKSKYFPESALAHKLLDGLVGLECGGSIHNAFGLDTLNVDYTDDLNTVFKQMEKQLTFQKNGVSECMPVDIIANGDNIPVPDKSFDFVISSHVIEHFFDPIKAIKEWTRIAKKYVFIVCPYPDADPGDVGLPLTELKELQQRHTGEIAPPEVDDHRHWTRWTLDTFKEMCKEHGWRVSHWQPISDKVPNGFTVVIDVQPNGSK